MQKSVQRSLFVLMLITAFTIGMSAQAPAPPAQGAPGAGRGGPGGGAPGGGAPGGGGGGQNRGGGRGATLTVTSTAWPDGDVIPAKYANAGEKKSPAFDLKWVMGTADATAPATLQSYAILFHDIENVGPRGGTSDTLHWLAWDFPGTLTKIPEGLPMGDLPDGTKQAMAGIGRGAYFGPGAGAGPYHHYIFEFYALDTKLNLPNTATRAEVMAAMEGHVIGKAAFTGRYHQ